MAANEAIAKPPTSGMIVRSKETLEPGQVIFKLGHRFVGNNRLLNEEIISASWWFTSGAIELISKTWNGEGSLSDTFRLFGAIAKRWGGSADLIVKAKIMKPLVAYIGPGTIQDFRCLEKEEGNNLWDLPLWVPSPSIPQLFIPLAHKGDNSSSVAKQALTDVYLIPIDKWDDGYLLHDPSDKWKI